MSVLGKYLPHPPAGSGSWGDAGEPLDAGRWTVLRNNAVFLAQANASRHIAEHNGFRGIYRPAIGGTSFTDPPAVQQIPVIYTRKTGGSFLDFGVHWFHPAVLGETSPTVIAPFGTVVLRARWKVAGGYTLGVVLGASAGTGGPHAAQTVGTAQSTTTSATWADLTLTLPLTETNTLEVDMRPAAGASALPDNYQRGRLRYARLFFGAYCSSDIDTVGTRGQVVNISVHLAGTNGT
jgi:hypothetical protein